MTSKNWIRLLGAGAALLSLGLLLRALLRSGEDALRLLSEPSTLAVTLAASLAYAVLLLLAASAWALTLRDATRTSPSAWIAVVIYARCNVLKYLPGNVFQFGGRQVMARRLGWTHRSTLMATTLELASLPIMASVVALAALGLTWLGGGALPAMPLPATMEPLPVALGLAAALGLAVVAVTLARGRGVAMRALLGMAALQLCFFIGTAGLMAGLAGLLGPVGPAALAALAAAYLASWIVGFVVPGAPGGLGVREAVFLHLAAFAIPAPAALALAILARIVTSLGDLWLALAAHATALPDTEALHEEANP